MILSSLQLPFESALIVATLASMIIFLPGIAYAVDITMGSNGNLVFDPDNISITAGETVHFINGMLPPHNIIAHVFSEFILGIINITTFFKIISYFFILCIYVIFFII